MALSLQYIMPPFSGFSLLVALVICRANLLIFAMTPLLSLTLITGPSLLGYSGRTCIHFSGVNSLTHDIAIIIALAHSDPL